MASSKEIRGKIKSVENTKKITKAMEMVAASKMRKAQERMRQSRPYGEKIRTIASHLAIKIAEKQQLLETVSVAERLQKVIECLEAEIETAVPLVEIVTTGDLVQFRPSSLVPG